MLLVGSAALAEAPPLTQFEVSSQPPAADSQGQQAQLPLVGDGFNRMTVPVRLGASGPFQFLVDTGSDRTSVSRELVRKLGLEEQEKAVLHSATGQSQVRMAYLPELQTGRRSVRHIRAPMLDAADIGADGILGIDSLRSQRVVFDFRQGTLSIQSGDAGGKVDKDAIVVRARRMEGRLVITNAEVDGEQVNVVLDSGSTLTVGNSALRRRLERRRGVDAVQQIELVSVTGAALRGELVRVRHLDIGGARLEGMGIVFADAHTFRQLNLDRKPSLLLGMNALQGFDQVTIDFEGRRLSLVLPKGKRPDPA